jgi:hypothetical protein
MINILSSNADSPSETFKPVDREDGEDNIQWLGRVLHSNENETVLVMVGGIGPTDFRLRVAQAHVRSDLSPSNWSHVMLLEDAQDLTEAAVIEISLEPPRGFDFPTANNGMQQGDLHHYADPAQYPNIAVVCVPLPRKEVDQPLERYKRQRAVLDGVDLIVRWLAFVWGVGRSGNPLLDGFGIPSAAMLEIIIGAAGFDLTPGLESRASCPDAISQAAKYWHQYYQDQDKPALSGAYYAPHQYLEKPDDTMNRKSSSSESRAKPRYKRTRTK